MREREGGGENQRRNPNPQSFSNPNPFPNSNAISTIFVNNLPLNLDKFGLRGIFSRFGVVVDASIPGAQNGSKRFGFVKFKDQEVAGKCIQSFNSRVIRGYRVRVHLARRDCVRVWQVNPSNLRQNGSRDATNQSGFYPEGGEGIDLLSKIKSSLAAEFDKLADVRKVLDSFVGQLEELLTSKVHSQFVGVHPEDPLFFNADPPIISPSPSEVSDKEAGKERVEDSVEGGGSLSLEIEDAVEARVSEVVESIKEIEVVKDVEAEEEVECKEDSEANYESDDFVISSSSIPKVFSSGNLDSVMSEDVVQPVLGPPADELCFSFNSKPDRRRRKKSRKSRAKLSSSSSKPGVKRKAPCQSILLSQNNVKRLKCDKEIPSQGQDDESFGLEALFAPCEEGEGAFSFRQGLNDVETSIPSKQQVEVNSEASGHPDLSEDSLRVGAIRELNLANRLGVKVFDKKACISNSIRIRKEQKRFVEYCSSEENSQGSVVF